MFFTLSKVLGVLFSHPVNLLVLLAVVGFALTLTRVRRTGRLIASAAVLAFLAACFSPLGALLLRPLEDRFPQPPEPMAAPTGIVVLGGAMDEDLSAARGQMTMTEAAARLTSGAALAIRYPQARLVFTGGSADLRQAGMDEARGVRRLWLSLGIPEGRMRFEDESRNTYENATMTKALATPKAGETWLLVTSASHMPRSMGIFRQAGWPVTAYPVDYRTFGTDRDFRFTAVALDALRQVDVAMHEWIGLVAYRLAGRTNALFPGP